MMQHGSEFHILVSSNIPPWNKWNMIKRVLILVQWGMPTVSVEGVFGILAGVFASAIESVGDYYACARLSGSFRI